MCCFSGSVRSVAATRIFARRTGKDRQILVYEMRLSAAQEVAMVLPLPTPPKSADDAARFIDLSGYEGLFADLERGFPTLSLSRGSSENGPKAGSAAPLAVIMVGRFEASFVPSRADFSRLDARFRIDDAVWDAQPAYRDAGFAVFKLKAGEQKVHPMAFSFPTSDPARLFFPTVHVHDGKLHDKARFDHLIYAQAAASETLDFRGFEESHDLASSFTKPDKAAGTIAADAHVYRRALTGMLKNQDTWIGVA